MNGELQTDKLTELEKTTLRYLARGKTYREIADLRGVGAHSLSAHTCTIRNKLGARTNEQAVVMALFAGILE